MLEAHIIAMAGMYLQKVQSPQNNNANSDSLLALTNAGRISLKSLDFYSPS